MLIYLSRDKSESLGIEIQPDLDAATHTSLKDLLHGLGFLLSVQWLVVVTRAFSHLRFVYQLDLFLKRIRPCLHILS